MTRSEGIATWIMVGIAACMGYWKYDEHSRQVAALKPPEAPKPHAESLDLADSYKLSNGNSLGVPGALRRAVIFSDYECPYCGMFPQSPVYRQLLAAAKGGGRSCSR